MEGDEVQMDKLDKVPVPPATLVLRIVESGVWASRLSEL